MICLWILVSYVLGSLPFGIIIARGCRGIDPRTAGSGNPGATNVARLCGLPWGVLTLACDLLKGLIAVWISLRLTPEAWFHSACALAVVGGHQILLSRLQGRKRRIHHHRRAASPGGSPPALRGGLLPPCHCAFQLCFTGLPHSCHLAAGFLSAVRPHRSAASGRRTHGRGILDASFQYRPSAQR